MSSKSYFYVNFQILSNVKEDCRSFHPGVNRKQDWSIEEADLVILASPTKTGSSNQSTEKLVPKKKNLVFEETYLVTKERNLVPEERKLVPKERSLVPGERKLVPKEMTRTNLVPEERNKTTTAETLLKCDKCEYCSAHERYLKKHLRSHKQYTCPEHNFECIGEDTMKVHMRTHSNLNRFDCPQCHFYTSNYVKLAQHMEEHKFHFENLPKHKGTARKHGFPVHGEKPNQCNQMGCEYASFCPKNLKVHKFFKHFTSVVSGVVTRGG